MITGYLLWTLWMCILFYLLGKIETKLKIEELKSELRKTKKDLLINMIENLKQRGM